MTDVWVGVLAIIAGLALCFRGYLTMRLVLSIWGAFAGFGVGVAMVTAVTGDGVLTTALGWITGLLLALLFSFLAYAYFTWSVILATGSVGYFLGIAALVTLGIEWNWVLVLVGLAVGITLGIFALILDLPRFVLTIVSTIAGATAVTAGVMLFAGSINAADLDRGTVTAQINVSVWWYLLTVVLIIAGLASQYRVFQHPTVTVRDSWNPTPQPIR